MIGRQVRVEVVRISGSLEPLGGLRVPPRLGVYFEIDGDGYPASVFGQLQPGILTAVGTILELRAEYLEEVRDKIRASWEDLRKVFTGYAFGWQSMEHAPFDCPRCGARL